MKSIKLLNVSGKGHLIFTEEFSVDIPDVPLVCVYGPNGSGKTSFVDFVPLSIWGITENRFADNKKSIIYAQFSEIGFAETTWQVGDDVVKIRRNVNPKSRTQKKMIWVNGIQEQEADKDTTFNLTIAKYFGDNFTKETFLATAYTTQKSVGNILHVSVDERRKTTDQIFGLTAFQEPFQKVSDFVKSKQEELDQTRLLVSRIGDVKSFVSVRKENKAAVEVSERNIEKYKQEIVDASTLIDVRKDSLKLLENQNTDTSSLLEKQKELTAKKNNLSSELKLAQQKTANLTGLDGRLASVEKAKTVVPELEKEKAATETTLEEQQQKYSQAMTDRKVKLAEFDAEVTTAQNALDETEKEYNKKVKAKQDLEQKCNVAAKAKEGRDKTALLLETVGCAAPEFEVAAHSCKLLADARTAKADSASLTESILALQNEISGIVVDDSELVTGRTALSALLSNRDKFVLANAFTELAQAVQKTKDRIAELTREIAQGKDIISKEAEILESRIRLGLLNEEINEHTNSIAAIDSELLVVETQLKGFAEASDLLTATKKEIETREQEIVSLRNKIETEIKNISVKETETTQLEDKILQLGDLKKKEEELLETLDLGNELKIAYSPTGARALIVDAMSPQLSETINELLREYYGDEFLVEFRTVKTLQNGNQEECYDIMVHDKKPGVPVSTANNKSPGQQGILTEVVGLGVLIEAYRRSGLALKTIIRDEATAAMDSANAEKYLSMLLRARELTNIDSIMYITHNPVLAMRADAYLCIENGKINVRKELGIRE